MIKRIVTQPNVKKDQQLSLLLVQALLREQHQAETLKRQLQTTNERITLLQSVIKTFNPETK
jgi:hypothetical protein